MGLDISYCRNLKKLDCVFNEDGCPIDPTTREELDYEMHVYLNPHFVGRSEPLESGYYTGEDREGFRAGSYGGYNAWREDLAKLAGYPALQEERYGQVSLRHDAGAQDAGKGPFYELIYFSDCEGTIGPVVSAKLAKDFADFQEKANSFGDDYWRKKYGEWRLAFETASENGAVSFH
jgi:hypothetical protein